MPEFASCPVCGLAVQVLTAEVASLSRCPACAVPLRPMALAQPVIPVAEVVPAATAPAGFDWSQVSGSAHREEMGLPVEERRSIAERPLAPGWGAVKDGLGLTLLSVALAVAGIVALLGLGAVALAMEGQSRGEPRQMLGSLDSVILFAIGLSLAVGLLSVVARFTCCAVREERGNVRVLAWASAITTLVALALTLIPGYQVLTGSGRDTDPMATGAIGFLSFVLSGVGELLFLLFVREIGRTLKDADTITAAGRFFVALGVAVAGGLVAVIAVPLFLFLGAAYFQGPGALLVMLVAALLAAVGAVWLIVCYVQAVWCARDAVARRLIREGERSLS
jgi:hypothetical protein